MRGIVVGVIAVLALASSAFCEEKQKIIPVMGGVKTSGTSISRTLDSTCYLGGDGPSLEENTGLFVTGIKTCKGYYTERRFYEVAHKGKTYYINEDDLSIEEKDLERFQSFSEEEADIHKKGVLVKTRLIWLEAVQDSLKKLERTAPHGITVTDYGIFDVSEYTEGTGFRITFYNPGKKRIKYVTVNYAGYNAVDDRVKDYRAPSGTLTMKGIGPIEPGNKASYSEDYAWMTDVVESVKLTSIKVEYMDGTKKVIKNPKLVTLDSNSRNILDAYYKEIQEEEREKAEAAAEEDDEAPAAPAAEVAPAARVAPATGTAPASWAAPAAAPAAR